MMSANLAGPAVVRCDGCGPTLADRQMAADMAGWDGMNDPVVRDYAAQDDGMTPDHAEPPRPVRMLPASIERFADGEGEGSFQDRKSVVEGKSVSVRVDLGGRRILKKKKNTKNI